MVAKSYSTEFGKPCIWIEDLYLKEPYRHKGIGSGVLQFIIEQFPGCVYRLEVEEENAPAVHTYRKNGFREMPYIEMKKGR
jgi:ribosomal protein S18 acetylase RimI-like enzyme